MLVVTDVQPGSVSDGVLEPGDVLVRVNGKLVTQFEPLEAVLDDSVGRNVELALSRGGKLLTANLKVADLDASRRLPTSSSAMRCCTRSRTRRRAPFIARYAACSSRLRVICSMLPECHAAPSSPRSIPNR